MALEQALARYQGTILMVSHDFYTVANCMDYVLWVEDHKLRKVSIRKFRKMIYADHFDKDYLEYEQKKKTWKPHCLCPPGRQVRGCQEALR